MLTNFRLWLKVAKRKISPDFYKWFRSGFSSPSPQFVKMQILKNNSLPNSTWIETGTYLGDTTKKLAALAQKVITIEPEAKLSKFAATRLKKCKNIEFVVGTSEESLSAIIEKISGSTNFWLDGHYSGDITFKGTTESPIISELAAISRLISGNQNAVIFVDDFRLFVNSKESGYPPQDLLINWAKSHNLVWTVEQDIFIARP